MTDDKRRRSSKGDKKPGTSYSMKLWGPKKVGWTNQDIQVYRVQSGHGVEEDLQFVIYIPVDSTVQWHEPDAGRRPSKRSGGAGPTPSKRSKDSGGGEGTPGLNRQSLPGGSKSSKHSSSPGPKSPRGSNKSDGVKSKQPSIDSETNRRKRSHDSDDVIPKTSVKSPKHSLKSADDEDRPKRDTTGSEGSTTRTSPKRKSDSPSPSVTDKPEPVEDYFYKKKKSVYQLPPMFDSLDEEDDDEAHGSDESANLKTSAKKSSGGSRGSDDGPTKRKNTQESTRDSVGSKTKSPKLSKNSDDGNNKRTSTVEPSLNSDGSKQTSPKLSKASDNDKIKPKGEGSHASSLDSDISKTKSPKMSNDSLKRKSPGHSKTSTPRGSKESDDVKSKPRGEGSKQSSINSESNPRKRSKESGGNDENPKKDSADSKRSIKIESPKRPSDSPSRSEAEKRTSPEEYAGQKRKSVYDLPPPDWWDSWWSTETEGTEAGVGDDDDEDEEDEKRSGINPIRSSEERYIEHKRSVRSQKDTSSDDETLMAVPDNTKSRARSVHFDIPLGKTTT